MFVVSNEILRENTMGQECKSSSGKLGALSRKLKRKNKRVGQTTKIVIKTNVNNQSNVFGTLTL